MAQPYVRFGSFKVIPGLQNKLLKTSEIVVSFTIYFLQHQTVFYLLFFFAL